MKNMIKFKYQIESKRQKMQTINHLAAFMNTFDCELLKEVVQRLCRIAIHGEANLSVKSAKVLIDNLMKVIFMFPPEITTIMEKSKQNQLPSDINRGYLNELLELHEEKMKNRSLNMEKPMIEDRRSPG